ncbi:hypothetical protein VPNG_09182 [Cytospora leucostoma]|uniref:J domain-containing protein n=1 Tax=Cytospora leucostoma TaxID=1230097 RepID=A0A423VU73_9PEZI|nr:hypothetical protein VPNG_09182 [Cytospora leucostoma]
MKFSVLSLGLLALLTPLTAAWSKEDREIFRLRDELATYEGPDVTFYDFLGVKPSASQDDISKAYRKKSRSLHPDKVKQQLTAERAKAKKNKKPGVTVAKAPTQSEVNAAIKAASDRQTRLSIVANILKGPGRARYDHFISNGFPVWKGTNYFYERYRPGLGTVMVGVFIALGGGAHYLALYMGWKRQREFVERYIKFARHAAWGDNLGIPAVENIGVGTAAPPPAPEEQQPERALPTNRKMRRMQEREAKREASQEGSKRVSRKAAPRAASASGAATPTPAAGGPQGAKKRVVAENGKVLVVDSLGDVYLEQEDEEGNVEAFLLDPNEIHKPTIRDTALTRLPVWFYGRTVGRLFPKKNDGDDYEEIEEEEEEEEAAAGSDFKEIAAGGSDSSSGAGGKRTPSTGSADDDFELLDKSVEDISGGGGAKASGSQPQGKQGKSGKRKNKRK